MNKTKKRMKTIKAIDATLQEVIVGKTYGYTNSKNGYTTIVIGDVEKVTQMKDSPGVWKVLLVLKSRRSTLYGDNQDIRVEKLGKYSGKVTVNALRLFPVVTDPWVKPTEEETDAWPELPTPPVETGEVDNLW